MSCWHLIWLRKQHLPCPQPPISLAAACNRWGKGPFWLLNNTLKLKPPPTGQRTIFSSLPTRTLCTFLKHQYSAATTATRSQSGSRTGIIYCCDKINRHFSLCISSPPSSIISPVRANCSRGRQLHSQLSPSSNNSHQKSSRDMQIMDPSCVTRVLSIGPKKTGIASSRLGRLNKWATCMVVSCSYQPHQLSGCIRSGRTSPRHFKY